MKTSRKITIPECTIFTVVSIDNDEETACVEFEVNNKKYRCVNVPLTELEHIKAN